MPRHGTLHGSTVIAAVLMAAAVIVGACGSSGSAAASPAAASPAAAGSPAATVTASPTGIVAASAAAAPSGGATGSSTFRYELTGVVSAKVDGGKVVFNSNPYEHVVLFVEGSMLPTSDVTLYFPLDFAAGAHTLVPFKEIVEEGRISATSTTLDGVFYATSGTLDVTSLEGGVMSGSFEFEAADRADATRTVTVSGSFEGVQLPTV